MNNKTKRSAKTTTAPCACESLGLALNEFLQRLGPPEQARRHFEAARVEILKGLRAIIDERIERRTKRAARGENIKVE